jgi:dipeptidyl aminopeptidase/acylaminoacyl peptidase
MLLRRLVPAMLAFGMLAAVVSAAPADSAAPVGHLVFSEQTQPCGFVCQQRLTIVAGDASGEKGLTTGTIDSAPAWSPNGKLIAFWRTLSSGQVQLHVMRSDGSGDRTLRSSAGLDAHQTLTWSPDGKSILVTGARVVLGVSLAPHPKLSHAKVNVLFKLHSGGWSEIRLSPNGRWLALTKSWWGHGGSEIASLWLVHPSGKSLHEIAGFFNDLASDVELRAVSWSPDSRRLAFVAVPDAACGSWPSNPPPDLWTVGVDGKNAHEVWADTCVAGSWVAPDTVAPGSTTTWSPDGTEILYPTEDFSATSDPNRWGYQFHEANVSTGTIQPFAVPSGDCGGGPGSCKLADPQWTTP